MLAAQVPIGWAPAGDALRVLADWNLRDNTVHLMLRFKPRLGSFSLRHGAACDKFGGGPSTDNPGG